MTHRKSALHYWVRALILAGFSFYIVYLIQQDSLNYYIAPRMEIYVKLTALGLYAVAAFQAVRGWKEWHQAADAVACDCEHHLPRTRIGTVVTYGFFFVPLLLGFFTPDTLLGSAYAAQKGMNFSGASYYQLQDNKAVKPNNQAIDTIQQADTNKEPDSVGTEPPKSTGTNTEPDGNSNLMSEPEQDHNQTKNTQQPAAEEAEEATVSNAVQEAEPDTNAPDESLEAMFPYDIFTEVNAKHAMELYQQDVIEIPVETFMETLTSLDLYKENFIGKSMKISGFIYREDTMSDTQFAVGRIAMACCSADSMPFGVLADFPRSVQYDDDTWVEAVGEIDVTDFNGYEIILLNVTSITKIPEPETPYVYPNYDFGL